MVSNTSHHLSTLNKYVSLANYPWNQRAKVLFFPAHSWQTFKNLTQNFHRTALLTDETQKFALIKVGKKQNKKNSLTGKKIITANRCDETIHWQEKYLDGITILCSLWYYQPNAMPGCNCALTVIGNSSCAASLSFKYSPASVDASRMSNFLKIPGWVWLNRMEGDGGKGWRNN